MELKRLDHSFSVCQVDEIQRENIQSEFCFVAHTDEEQSLVCPTEQVPVNTLHREDGWKAFRIQGILDFSLIGVLAPIADILARHQIGIFVISTYNTDYVLVKEENYEQALQILADAGYTIV